jgi:hypothetical protein
MKRVKASDPLEPPTDQLEVAVAPDEAAYSLNIAGVYQDSVTRDWAMQSCRRATQLVGEESLQNAWYDANSLSDPGIFLDAVRAALVADVIVVSVYAADELPLDVYVWIQAWLPRRRSRAGALTALIGVAEPPDSQFVRTVEYLQAVASRAQLDFIPQERKRPAPFDSTDTELIAEPGSAIAQALKELYGQHHDSYHRRDLNE